MKYKFTKSISIHGFKHPCIDIQVEHEQWILVHLKQNSDIKYQYIGNKKAIKIFPLLQSYGQKTINTEDKIELEILDIVTFKELNVEVNIYEELKNEEFNYIEHDNFGDLTYKTTNETKYYKGDFHAHTYLSDGSLTPNELIKHAEEKNLDFFFITDHNFYHTYWPKSKVLVLPGIEYTSNKGHWNALNIHHELDMYDEEFNIESVQGTTNLINSLKQSDTIISMNHPFLTIWSWLHDDIDMSLFDCIEIWNDPSYKDNPKATEEALKFYQKSLETGHRLTAIGGSDFHHLIDYKDNDRENNLNDPSTYVFCDSLNTSNLLNSVKLGRVFVVRNSNISHLDLIINQDCYLFGDQLDISDNKVVVELCFNNIESNVRIDLFTKSERKSAYPKNSKVKFDEICLDQCDFIRFEFRNQNNNELIGYTNPVYKNEVHQTTSTFGDIKRLI